jgi:hypothetical protein
MVWVLEGAMGEGTGGEATNGRGSTDVVDGVSFSVACVESWVPSGSAKDATVNDSVVSGVILDWDSTGETLMRGLWRGETK